MHDRIGKEEAEEGAETAVWLATRSADGAETGLLWEDRQIVQW